MYDSEQNNNVLFYILERFVFETLMSVFSERPPMWQNHLLTELKMQKKCF